MSTPPSALERYLSGLRNGRRLAANTLTAYSRDGALLLAPAGDFSALKVTAQVDITTVMPNWPRFVMHVVQPVVPKNVLYFQATPPYRLLKQQGTTFVGGPEVTTELMRYYVAGAPPVVVSAVSPHG